MTLGNLKESSGLQTLNNFLAEKSYIEGYQSSQADAVVFEAVGHAPDAEKLPHVARWYKHINSFGDKRSSLPGTKKPVDNYGPTKPVEVKKETKPADDDLDLFGEENEEENEETKRVLEEYRKKKDSKPKLIAKSNIILDVKPWDDETDMKILEEKVRNIQLDGLIWGASKLVPVGFGIKKLQISCVVEDDKVGTDILEEEILSLEDYVQSMDVAAFNKV